jgi:hypothetical protein
MFRLANVKEHLLIKLPVHPSTIEELALVRFWLLRLSQTHFEEFYAEANRGILNPEFLSVLNPRARKILFHANVVDLNDYKAVIPADFAQFICARQIFLQSSIDEPYRNNILNFIMGTRITLEKVRINSHGENQIEFCEFLVKVKL